MTTANANRLANTTNINTRQQHRYLLPSYDTHLISLINMPDSLQIALKNDSDSENIHAYVVSSAYILLPAIRR